MNFITEDQFKTCMTGGPKPTAEIVQMLSDDLAVCLAILGGPKADQDIWDKLLKRTMQNIASSMVVASRRIKQSVEGGEPMVYAVDRFKH